MEKYRVGDKVWNYRIGWGIVKEINLSEKYPVTVKHGNKETPFTTDGKLYVSDKYPSLWFDEIEIPKRCLERPKDPLIEGCIYEIVNIDDDIQVAYYTGIENKFTIYEDNIGTNNGGIGKSWRKIN